MEKGLMYSVFAFALVLSIMALSSSVYAFEVCTDGNTSTECVCGHTPNSTLGYGQVIIGPNVYSCNNIADGLCPEDYTNGTLVGNCTSCADADCSVGGPYTPPGPGPYPPGTPVFYVYGNVRDTDGTPIPQTIVTGHPIKWDPTVNLDRNTTTGASGAYLSTEFITGTYYFSAAKDGYDTQLIKATVTRSANTTINFTLQNGTCHEDCTNSYNRCNAVCDGVNFTTGESCRFFNNEAKMLCNNREKGTLVKLSQGAYTSNDTHAYFVECCEAAPQLQYYSKIQADTSSNIKNVVKIEKIAKYNDVPVRIVVAYWQE